MCTNHQPVCRSRSGTQWLKEKKVVVVPGTAFGECGEGFLRISYAYSLEKLKEALDRMEEFVTELRAKCK